MPGIVPMNVTLPIILSEKISLRRRSKSLPIIVHQIRYKEKQEDGEKEIRPFVSGSLVDSLVSGCIRKNYEICQKKWTLLIS